MNSRLILGLVITSLLLLVGTQSLFVVPEHSTALVLQLGEPQETARTPGLNFKLPLVQSVVLLDSRIQMFTLDQGASLTADSKKIAIDNYVAWRIVDPLVFIKTFGNTRDAEERLHRIVSARLRAAIGGKSLQEIIGVDHSTLMQEVRDLSGQDAKTYGVEVVDVRIKRVDLPNRNAIFERMKAERERLANEYQASGESVALQIRAQADLDRAIILAEAERDSNIIRATADAKALEVLSSAIVKTGSFYEFAKSLETYQESFKQNTTIILSTDDPLLRYLK